MLLAWLGLWFVVLGEDLCVVIAFGVDGCIYGLFIQLYIQWLERKFLQFHDTVLGWQSSRELLSLKIINLNGKNEFLTKILWLKKLLASSPK
jgi:hypothetical protein